jgi:DNA-binding transcriptional LysR family regulator
LKKISELNFDLKQLRSFLEVLNENSFTRASRKLKVGQATISHHIGQLEKTLGVKLVNRTARDVSATEEGKIFLAFCEKIFKNIETLTSDFDRGALAGLTRIAASTIPAAYILPKILAAVKQQFPAITYRLEVADSREAVEMVKEGRADVGIVGKEYKHPSLVYKAVCRDDIVLVGPKGFPGRVTVKDLVRLPFIIRESGSGTRKSAEEVLARHGITTSYLQTVLECSSTEGIKESIAAGLGVSFISKMAVSRETKQKKIKIIEVDGLSINRSFYFVYSSTRHLMRPAALLFESLLEFGKTKGSAEG